MKPSPRASALVGIHLKVGSALCMTLMMACVKRLDGAVPAGEIVFYRSAVPLVPLLVWMLRQRSPAELFTGAKLARHLGRGLSGSAAMFLIFVTLACLPLADAVMLGYAAPLMTVLLAQLFLKEKVPGYRWLGAILGSLGVFFALSPHWEGWQRQTQLSGMAVLGIAAGLSGAICSAVSTIQIRGLAVTEQPGTIVFYYTVMTGLLGGVTALFGWVMPDVRQLSLMLFAGVFSGISQFLMAKSLRHADASVIAPFEYTTLLWSILISYSVFDQAPSHAVIFGGALVMTSGSLTIWQEWRVQKPHRAWT